MKIPALSKRLAKAKPSVMAGAMTVTAVLFPLLAEGQETNINIFATGTVGAILGTDTGAIIGDSVSIAIPNFDPNSLTLVPGAGNGSSSPASLYSSPNPVMVSINGGVPTQTLGYQVGINDNTIDQSGNNIRAVNLFFVWGTELGDSVGLYCPYGTVTTSSPTAISTLLTEGMSHVLPYPGDYTFTVGATPGGDFATGDLSTFFVTPAPPPIAIQLGGTNVSLSWTTNTLQDYQLVQNSSLLGTNWTTVTNLPAVTNGLNIVCLPATNRWEFFRLQGTN